MRNETRVQFLRGDPASVATPEPHPILELSDDELRSVIGGVDAVMGTVSAMTGSNPQPTPTNPCACCDGVTVCCDCN
jgi:hypothetical protein